jgi:hypothetical protein
MGWTYIHSASRKQVKAEILSADGDYFAVAHKTAGDVFWVVWEHKRIDPESRFITCYLFDSHNGYKPMDEASGPYQYSCPLQFLDITPVPDSPFADEWRKEVRNWHAQPEERGQRSTTQARANVPRLKLRLMPHRAH